MNFSVVEKIMKVRGGLRRMFHEVARKRERDVYMLINCLHQWQTLTPALTINQRFRIKTFIIILMYLSLVDLTLIHVI